ncbi:MULTISPECIES: hypothetical protein [unclassified Rhodococcus (in: high G+C Gram-positive bacteria)]|jgi:hypothetical protein|uniref:hypothetical protein n=1 Tax=unclassified Rhodococcus (in: high G+C Gram-positive bacteria) TaxID=192944 RepID=UPI00031B28F3|nr:hypothetical protein [Rhodococcus sp. DK17]
MTTWTLWIGALLVVGGSVAQLAHQVVVARALWVLAVLAFVATAALVMTMSELLVPLGITVVVAIAATGALLALTREPAKSAAARKDAE